jgi:hypothetical protein
MCVLGRDLEKNGTMCLVRSTKEQWQNSRFGDIFVRSNAKRCVSLCHEENLGFKFLNKATNVVQGYVPGWYLGDSQKLGYLYFPE